MDDKSPLSAFKGRTWVTRKRVGIDRIACAWLIRRFIDKKARFKFVEAKGYKPAKGEVRFDMFEAEFTHRGDLCTFEVLTQQFFSNDRALGILGEVIHDLDLKDGRFAHPETAGIERLIEGVILSGVDDEARITEGGRIFDGLYRSFAESKVPTR